MQVFFDEIGVLDRVVFCKNGEEVVEYFQRIFYEIQTETEDLDIHLCTRPITLLLMDINMPFKSGLESKKEVCKMFEDFNDVVLKKS